jgi:hypothetical protein
LLKHTGAAGFFVCYFLATAAMVNADESRLRLFREYGIGLGGGVFVLERAVGRDFDVMAAYGADLYLEMLGFKGHQVVLQSGYFRPIDRPESGSEQVTVSTSYHRFHVAMGYTAHWLCFLSDLRLGLSMAVISTETSLYDLGAPSVETAVGVGEPDRYQFPNKTLAERHKATGLSNGFLINVGLGVDAGDLLMNRPRLLEFRVVTEYVRRDERNEIMVSYLWSFWPSALR